MVAPDRPTDKQHANLAQEQEIVDLMIGIYCKGMKHERMHGDLCAFCGGLQSYTVERNEQCPFLQNQTKTFCQFCETHCYVSEKRQAIIEVMRYAGPRMLWHRPVLAIKHLIGVRRHQKCL